MLPQAEGCDAPWMGQEGFFSVFLLFSNAQLVCLFTENSFPMGDKHICP